MADDTLKVYHYTETDKWSRIKTGSWTDDEPGLDTLRRLSPWIEDGREIVCSFALLEPEPEAWTHNPKHPDIWNDLMGNTGSLLLEVDITSHKDNAHIVDFKHRENHAKRMREGEKPTREEAFASERAYVASKIPFSEYLEQGEKLQYELPEVIITKRVPLEDVKIAAAQPKLEKQLHQYRKGSGLYNSVRREIARVAELRPWAANEEDRDLQEAIKKEIQFEEEYNQNWQ